MTTKEQEVYQAAERLYRKELDWASFYRETMGANGLIRSAFPDVESQAAFQQTYEYSAIQLMLVKLRERADMPPQEATRVITIRLPQSLHEGLQVEAESLGTSVNKLCISKLVQIINNDLIPSNSAAKAARETEVQSEPAETP